MSIIPLFSPHPRGYANPVTFRVSAALAGAGAWDAAPVESSASGAAALTLSLTYTRGAAGGAFDFQIETSSYSVVALVPAGASEWVTASVYDPGAVAGGADTQSRVQREYITFASQGAAAEDFVYGPISLHGTIERIRISGRESGIVATPGTLSIVGVLL